MKHMFQSATLSFISSSEINLNLSVILTAYYAFSCFFSGLLISEIEHYRHSEVPRNEDCRYCFRSEEEHRGKFI